MDRHATADMLRSLAKAANMSMHELTQLTSSLATEHDDVPTVAEFVRRLEQIDGVKAGWAKRKGLYAVMVDAWGSLRLDQVKASDVEAISVAQRQAVVAREDERQDRLADRGLPGAPRRTGRGAERNFLEAARRLFTVAVNDGLLSENPAKAIALPARRAPTSRSLKSDELSSLWSTVVGGGDDPELDGLLVWFHLETGARRGGALALRVRDLKTAQCTVTLYEKGRHGKVERAQPVSKELLTALLEHARQRSAARPSDAVFHYRDSTPATPHPLGKKRYETLITRIRTELPWASDRWMKLHDLRRTGVTFIERISGSPAVARLFAGHSTGTSIDTYDHADEDELSAALAAYLGRPVGRDAVSD